MSAAAVQAEPGVRVGEILPIRSARGTQRGSRPSRFMAQDPSTLTSSTVKRIQPERGRCGCGERVEGIAVREQRRAVRRRGKTPVGRQEGASAWISLGAPAAASE